MRPISIPIRLTTAMAAACLAGCRTSSRPGAEGARPVPDSIVLERGPCFGTCPSYRLGLARNGAVNFQSRNRGDSARVQVGTITPDAFRALADEAVRIGFYGYPASIMGSPYCGQVATDLPTATVSIFTRGTSKRVEDYHGCFGAPPELRRFEAAIDSVAGSGRWVRPARFR